MKIEDINIHNIKSFFGTLPFNNVESYRKQENSVNLELYNLVKNDYKVITITELKNTFSKVDGHLNIEKVNKDVNSKVNTIYKLLINSIGVNKFTFISNWIYTNNYNLDFLPKWYGGKIYRREGDLTFFLEWLKDQDMTHNSFWWHGTWGFITESDNLELWTQETAPDSKAIKNFLDDMYIDFVLKGEADELMMLVKNSDIESVENAFKQLII